MDARVVIGLVLVAIVAALVVARILSDTRVREPVGAGAPVPHGAAAAGDDVRGFHFPAFDGLRAIAALAVALTHSLFISGFNLRNNTWGPYAARLDIGVAVFFVISGFLLYRPFVLARLRGRGALAAVPYFQRRFLRIFPAFWLVFTLVLLVPALHGTSFQRPSFGGLVAHYTLTHIYFHDHVLGPVQQSWTLATEVSFYVMLPLWAALMRRLGDRPRQLLVSELGGLALLYAISIAFRLWLFGHRPASWNGMYNTWLPARVDLFALGMLLAVASAWIQAGGWAEPRFFRHRLFPWLCWLAAITSFWFLSVGFGLNDTAHRGPTANFSHPQQMWLQFFWGATGFFLVAPAVFGPQEQGAIRRALNNRVLQWLGLVSYGIYLWHEAMIDWYLRITDAVEKQLVFRSNALRMTVFMLVTMLVVAALSYYIVERPALRLKDRDLFGRLRGRRTVRSSR